MPTDWLSEANLRAERARLLDEMPQYGGRGGPGLQLGLGVGTMVLGGLAIPLGIALGISGDTINAFFFIGLLTGSVMLGVGLIVVCIGLVRTLIAHSEGSWRLERLEAIDAELRRLEPPRASPWNGAEAL